MVKPFRSRLPVPKIHNTPFSTVRASFGGRPFPSGRRFDRRIGSSKAHCSSLSSQRPCMGLVRRQIARSPLVCLVSAALEPSFFSSGCQRTIFETSCSKGKQPYCFKRVWSCSAGYVMSSRVVASNPMSTNYPSLRRESGQSGPRRFFCLGCFGGQII